MSEKLSTQDTLIKAWKKAVGQNTITQKLVFHSDRETQQASYYFPKLILNFKGPVGQSISRKSNCWNNAVAASFLKSSKVEWVYKHHYERINQAELSIFQWIETWYNKKKTFSFGF